MGGGTGFQSLLIICLTAFVIPIIVGKIKKIQFPVVVAEIIFGIFISKNGLNLVRIDPILDFLSLLGFAYLMFLSGLDIDISALNRVNSLSVKVNPLKLSLKIFLFTVGLSFFFALVLQGIGITNNPLFLTLIFATTSLGIVIPSLRSKGIINQPIGQIIIITALIADLVTLIFVPVVMYFITGENGIDLFYTGSILGVAILIYLLSKMHWFGNTGNLSFETSQMTVRASFALMLIFVTLAEIANIEIIFGAFIAGILYSFLFASNRDEIKPKLEAIGYGFLIPIFFIMVGVTFNLTTVFNFQTYLLLPLFIYIAYLVKLIPALILRKYYGWRVTLGAGFLLSSRLSLIISLSYIALRESIISQSTHAVLIIVAMITCLFSPLIFMVIFLKY